MNRGMRVLQTLALPLGYVTVFHCPGQRLDGYYNIPPRLCQGAILPNSRFKVSRNQRDLCARGRIFHVRTANNSRAQHISHAAGVFHLPARANFVEKSTAEAVLFSWSGRRGSNSLPRPWQGRALPDELRPQMVPPVGVEPTTRGFSVRCSTN